MNKDDNDILFNILNEEISEDSIHNIRKNGETVSRHDSDEISIVSKKEKQGIEIYVKSSVKNQVVQVPVLLTTEGFTDVVYNDYNVSDNAEVTIVAGCAIHNDCEITSMHSGVHAFNIGKNAKVKYVEKHYGCGQIDSNRIINTDTIINLGKGSSLVIETVQISGVDKSTRNTIAVLEDESTLEITEKLMTASNDNVLSSYKINLNGVNTKANLISRSIAKNNSCQEFVSELIGNNKSFGHIECDAIIMDNAKVSSTPKIIANNVDAELTHEAAIGKISGEQLLKLETLGLTKEEAEAEIIKGFMK